jgi:hypothetical protein
MWHNIVLQIEWLAWLLVDKAEQGHCYKHKPCPDTATLHLRMAKDFKSTVETLLKTIDGEITRVETKWKTAATGS